jgi:hypothetical protein
LLIEACPQHEEVVITEECILEAREEAHPPENVSSKQTFTYYLSQDVKWY